ncbi:hypothetical protein BJ973_004441 [Actinoplanes tereljensis]|uniref:Uncharacterized protein n=1 Tax=Paractinoplanes tereljensis TaxID=571912 RepID=A0A919NRJ7_9ACTN|nr:hypothetical protein [Actinoplanes tereljensis]GIF23829.1 hypothetical protein Ate02nite_65590 [Actinoplanes tereljensis]
MGRTEREVFRYRVDFGGGERDVVSLLEPEWVDRHGLHPEAVVAVVGAEDPTPADIRENGPFLRLLSRVIFENIDHCEYVRREAEIQVAGFVYLLDERTPDPGGRVDQADIVGEVEVRNGTLVPGSYRHNPRHRLFTTHGWFGLPPEIEAPLQDRLRSLRLR